MIIAGVCLFVVYSQVVHCLFFGFYHYLFIEPQTLRHNNILGRPQTIITQFTVEQYLISNNSLNKVTLSVLYYIKFIICTRLVNFKYDYCE